MENDTANRAENSQDQLSRVKAVIEHVLKEKLNKNSRIVRGLKGKLTTDPQGGVDIETKALRGGCGTICDALQEGALTENLLLDKRISEDRDGNVHVYLVTELSKGSELIIDPTIGQFIKGHNHVFVGNRTDLHNLVVNQTGKGKIYSIINTKSRNKPDEAFRRIWGYKGKPYGAQMTNPEHRKRSLELLETIRD